MGRNPEEAAILRRIEASHIEVPVIIGQQQQIRLHQFALLPLNLRELLGEPDDAV